VKPSRALVPYLRTAPLLWLFLLVGGVAASYAGWRELGVIGLAQGPLRLAHLGLSVWIIQRLTQGQSEPDPQVRRLWPEIVILTLYLLWLALIFSQQVRRLDFSHYAPGYSMMVQFLRHNVAGPLISAFGWEGWNAARLNALLLNLTTQMLIPLIPFLLLGYGLRSLGFRSRWWWLALPLSLVTLLFTIVAGGIITWTRLPIAFLFNLGISGLTGEFWARGLLQTRLERVLNHPLHGAVLAALIFGLMNVPANMRLHGSDWPLVIALCIGPQALVGFGLGYLWLKTRSLAPGALWQAFGGSLV